VTARHHHHLEYFICTHVMDDGSPGPRIVGASTCRATSKMVADGDPDITHILDLPKRAWAEQPSTDAQWRFEPWTR
jgi:hypothetical protein